MNRNTDFREHSIQLHKERNGWSARYRDYQPDGHYEIERYVFSTYEEMIDFLLVNFVGLKPTEDHDWHIGANPRRALVPK